MTQRTIDIDPRTLRDIEAMARKLFADGKLIESGWERMRMINQAANSSLSRNQFHVMRQCYFLGARQVFSSVMEPLLSKSIELDVDDFHNTLELISKELNEFVEGVLKGDLGNGAKIGAKILDPYSAHDHAPNVCAGCGMELDISTALNTHERRAPVQGDVTVCGHCGAFLRFGDQLTFVVMSVEDIAALPDHIRIDMQRARRFVENRR